MGMKKLNVTIEFAKVGVSSIMVPDNLTLEEAIKYAKEHIDEILLPSQSNYISDSDIIYEDKCNFDEDE